MKEAVQVGSCRGEHSLNGSDCDLEALEPVKEVLSPNKLVSTPEDCQLTRDDIIIA